MQAELLKEKLASADAIVVGAGAGLSAAAGFSYSGERFAKHFADFGAKYGFRDMYSGGFCDFDSPEESWAYWSRYIYINRYAPPPEPRKNVYENLLRLVRGKEYFVITTNVDHCFQRSGFDKARLFYTQGDFGLFQCGAQKRTECRARTFDNKAAVEEMLASQGYIIEGNALFAPEKPKMRIDSSLVPRCPFCGSPMAMNLRSDSTFVEDEGWHAACTRYKDFLAKHSRSKTVYLELGVGANTPAIIKYPFWELTAQNPNAFYVAVSLSDCYAPPEIAARSMLIEADIADMVGGLCDLF